MCIYLYIYILSYIYGSTKLHEALLSFVSLNSVTVTASPLLPATSLHHIGIRPRTYLSLWARKFHCVSPNNCIFCRSSFLFHRFHPPSPTPPPPRLEIFSAARLYNEKQVFAQGTRLPELWNFWNKYARDESGEIYEIRGKRGERLSFDRRGESLISPLFLQKVFLLTLELAKWSKWPIYNICSIFH